MTDRLRTWVVFEGPKFPAPRRVEIVGELPESFDHKEGWGPFRGDPDPVTGLPSDLVDSGRFVRGGVTDDGEPLYVWRP